MKKKKLDQKSLLKWANAPQALPTTVEQLDLWVNQVLKGFKLPEQPSYRQRIAELIMHNQPVDSHTMKPITLVNGVKRAMANQIAYNLIDDIRVKAKEERLAAEKAAVEAKIKECEATHTEASLNELSQSGV